MLKFLIGGLLGAIIQNLTARWLRERARLVYYLQNISDHNVNISVRPASELEPSSPTKTFRIYTHSMSIRNDGERVANNVEVVHTFLPQHITITPLDIQHTINRERRLMGFDKRNPTNTIDIELKMYSANINIQYSLHYRLTYSRCC